MEIFNSFFKYFTDKDTKFLNKSFLFVIVLMSLFIVDNLFGFSYYYNLDRKVASIENINRILLDSTLSAKERNELKRSKEVTITRKNFKDKAYIFIAQMFSGRGTDVKRNALIHFLTAGSFSLLLFVLMPFFYEKEYYETFGEVLRIILVAEIIFIALAALCSWLLSFIPIINHTPIWNYLINIVVNVFLFMIVYVAHIKTEDKK